MEHHQSNSKSNNNNKSKNRYGIAVCGAMLAYAKGFVGNEECEATEIFSEGALPSFAVFLVCSHQQSPPHPLVTFIGSKQVSWSASYTIFHA